MDIVASNELKNELLKHKDKEKLKKFYRDSLSKNTKRSLLIKWRVFQEWCEEKNFTPLPANEETVALFLIDLRENHKKISTILAYNWAINKVHQEHNFNSLKNSNFLKNELKGIKRNVIRTNPDQAFPKKKEAFSIEDIKSCKFPDNHPIKALRDKSLLLLGFASGMRSSELSQLQIDRINQESYGLKIHIVQSKTNQEGSLEYVDVVFGKNENWCPVKTLENYIKLAKIRVGYVFRACLKGGTITRKPISTDMIRKIVKSYADSIGKNPDNFGAHSLRSGCATFFLDNNVKPHIVQKQLRHKSVDTTLGYNRKNTASDIEGLY